MAATIFLASQRGASTFTQDNDERALRALQRYWGYESFRAGQEEIVESMVHRADYGCNGEGTSLAALSRS